MSKKNKAINKNENKNNNEKEEILETKNNKKNQKKQTTESDKKNNRKHKKHEETVVVDNSNNEMLKLLKIVLIVTGIMVIFYGITLVATNKADETIEKENNDNQPSETQIQYENILIGSMLNNDGTYYVLIEEKDDNRLAEYDSLIATIKASEDAPAIYKANLTDSFNKDYLGKEHNYYVNDIADFKVTGTTLVKIKDRKIDSVSDNYDAIKNKLKELS